MEIIGKQSTKSKSYSTQRQEIHEIICYAAARNKRSRILRIGKDTIAVAKTSDS